MLFTVERELSFVLFFDLSLILSLPELFILKVWDASRKLFVILLTLVRMKTTCPQVVACCFCGLFRSFSAHLDFSSLPGRIKDFLIKVWWSLQGNYCCELLARLCEETASTGLWSDLQRPHPSETSSWPQTGEKPKQESFKAQIKHILYLCTKEYSWTICTNESVLKLFISVTLKEINMLLIFWSTYNNNKNN